MLSKMSSTAVITMIAASLFVTAAGAHPKLQSVEPAAGAAVTTSPQQIRITFNENVIPQMSGVEVKDQTGKVIPTGKAATDPANKKLLVVPVNEQLPPGDYKVEWHVVSDDTHRVEGSYSFSVAR
jgi:methionine-rich copper-binding protein CopC